MKAPKQDTFPAMAARLVNLLSIYPLVICYIAIENDPVEIVDVPIENGDFP